MTGWECANCGWPWPLAGDPPETAECDNCGDDEFQRRRDERPAAEELRRTYEDAGPELPQDPTGVDCLERYESPADQA